MAKSNRKKVAFISGITGMDGSHLADLLLEKGYEVHGLVRRASTFNRERLNHIHDRVHLHYGDMTDPFSILWALKLSKPDEVYNLAAQSHVQVSWETPWYTAQTTGIGVLNILEAVRVLGLKCKIYQASTSELFDGLSKKAYTESSEKNPISPYGTAKLYGFQIAKNYREAHGMFICNGILFNHESDRRGINFVTMKIVRDAVNGHVTLGNIKAKRDWGYAPDYVEGMWRMLQQRKPDDYILATGETHSVKEFVGWVAEYLGHPVRIDHDDGYDRPVDVPVLKGDPSKAKRKLKWKATVKGKELVSRMYKNYEGD